MNIGNYGPAGVLSVFFNFLERIIKKQVDDFIDNKISKFISA